MTVDGFAPGAPVMTKVSWVEGEVPLENAQATAYGLLAEYASARWFVPWAQISYMRQDLTTAGATVVGQEPTVYQSPVPPAVLHD